MSARTRRAAGAVLFVLHPGTVISRSGDRSAHYVALGHLVRLYGIRQADWRPCSCLSSRGGHVDVEGSINLYPRYEGDYWDATIHGAQSPDGKQAAPRPGPGADGGGAPRAASLPGGAQ